MSTDQGSTGQEGTGQGASGASEPGRADYRFLFANERTFLAYVRTALALQVAGLGALQFLTQGHDLVRYALGVVLVATGSLTGIAGLRRMRRNEKAMRAGEDITPGSMSTVLVAVVVVIPLVAALTMLAVS
jgi:putative membrane protein